MHYIKLHFHEVYISMSLCYRLLSGLLYLYSCLTTGQHRAPAGGLAGECARRIVNCDTSGRYLNIFPGFHFIFGRCGQAPKDTI